jgi:beta-galactosidase
VDVRCFLEGPVSSSLTLEVELLDGDNILSKASQKLSAKEPISKEPFSQVVTLNKLGAIRLWDVQQPHLYSVRVRLMDQGKLVDEDSRRCGFREASFTDQGFSLNGKVIKLRGLDRHQTFPFVGQAMPGRVQRRDAQILRQQLRCNIVRTSHYPQSRHFLDACDELGLLVLEEIPGWQHIGDLAWQDISVDNVRRMIRRDWNHPSIILWGVRINESRDNHDFYTRTNAAAHALDPSRQTGGIRYFQESEFLEDVFTMNDFGFPLLPPVHSRYLNTEFVGHTFPTKTIDSLERLREHTIRHARVHDQLASNPQYAGGIGWCAFDYNTHANFGSGDRICYHGVSDIFREPKPAAGFYKSQCEPSEEIVLEPTFHWARNDESVGFTVAMVCSNCDHLKFFVDDGKGYRMVAEGDPDRKQFSHLRYAPFSVPLGEQLRDWGDLRIDGFIDGKQVISKKYSGKGIDQQFALLPDDTELIADGADTTRVVLRVNDEYGQVRPFANDPIVFEIDGPAEIIGDNPFALIGGTGAIWIRAKEEPGTVRLRGKHPVLGMQEISFRVSPSTPEVA